MEQTVAAGFVRALKELAISKEADAAELDRRSGIDPDALHDVDERIPLEVYKRLLRAGQELTGDAALALHFGEAFDLASLSIVGLLGEASTSFGEAFDQLGRYSRLAIDVELEEEANGQRLILKCSGGKLWLVDTRKDPNAFPELTESSFARMAATSRRYGTHSLLRAVHVTHPAPSYREEYDRLFGMPVVFEAKWNAIQLSDDSWRTMSPRLSSRYMSDLLQQRADDLVNALDRSTTVRDAVEKVLLKTLPSGKPGMAAVARDLGMSRATLFRRLRQENAAFHEVLDQLRSRLAFEYLEDRNLPVGRSGQLLGFSDQASFSRAFKRWTGTNPGTLRRQARSD